METQWIKVDQYTALRVANYQGEWQLQVGNINKQGEIFLAYSVPTWQKDGEVHLRQKNAGGDLNIPNATGIGSVKEDALAVIGKLYNMTKALS